MATPPEPSPSPDQDATGMPRAITIVIDGSARAARFALTRGRLLFDVRSARERRLLIDTAALGIAGALAAQVFGVLLHFFTSLLLGRLAGYTAPGLPNEGGTSIEIIGRFGFWLVPLSMTVGGLLVGLLTERFAPEAEGHGTDAVIRAFHRSGGFLRPRVPFVKLLASAITIGSGGVAGREGPMALITGGLGSWYATATKRDDADRRLLLLVGMSAGLSAIFRSPIGAALLAVEILYADMEFEPGALLYTALGAIVAYAVNGMFVGWEPLFRVSSLAGHLTSAAAYGWYIVLGVAAGVVATVLPVVFYRTRDAFRRIPVKPYWRPAIGGLAAGVVALGFPKVIGGGYGWMQQAIDGQLALFTLATLIAAKMVAMSFTVASGGSGGVFAPTLFIGAMLGGSCAIVFHQAPAPFVVVGMAAVFAGAAHVPIATMMMVTEMTGGYQLLVPATLAVVVSYIVQRRLSSRFRYRSVYEGQVANPADSLAHHTKHLEIALRILRQKGVTDLSRAEDIDLLTPLLSGIPVELPGDRRLLVGLMRPQSPLVRATVTEAVAQLDHGRTNIIGILRGEHMLAPRPELVLQEGDRVILVASAEGLETVWKHFTQW
jgi:CIC family chloride channel protein